MPKSWNASSWMPEQLDRLVEDRLEPLVDQPGAERQPEDHAQEDRRDREQDQRARS